MGALGNATSATRTITVNGGTLWLQNGNDLGNSSASPAIGMVINAGGAVVSSADEESLGPSLTLGGGSLVALTGAGGTSADFQAFSFGQNATATVTASGATLSQIILGPGVPAVAGSNGFQLAPTTTFNVTGTGGLLVTMALTNETGVLNAASLVKTGTGLMTMSGLSTYSGGTTVSAGTLLVNPNNLNTGASLLGSGTVAIGAGATLETWTNSFGTIAASLPPVAVNGGALISLGGAGQDSRLGALTMTGGTVSGNQFDPVSGVTTLGSTAESLISVNTLRLEANNTFNVTAGTVSGGPDLLVTSNITQERRPLRDHQVRQRFHGP